MSEKEAGDALHPKGVEHDVPVPDVSVPAAQLLHYDHHHNSYTSGYPTPQVLPGQGLIHTSHFNHLSAVNHDAYNYYPHQYRYGTLEADKCSQFSASDQHAFVKQEPSTYHGTHHSIEQKSGIPIEGYSSSLPFIRSGSHVNGIPFIKQESGLHASKPPFNSEIPSIKQEPGVHLAKPIFIKQEPSSCTDEQSPLIKHNSYSHAARFPFIKKEPDMCNTPIEPQSCMLSEGMNCMKQEPGLRSTEEVTTEHCRKGAHFIKNESALDCGVSFPSQPINLNFMSDIEDIVQPTYSVSIDSIQRELSNCGDSSDPSGTYPKGKIKREEPIWEPPLWRQQYENIRSMRSKRDAPVDKYGCFMNAEKDVAPEVRRYQVLISLMLSSQTKDEIVGKAMSKLKENGLTINSILDTPQEEIARMIFPVGFWNKKAEYIKKTTKILSEKYDNDIPNSVEGLISLSGIGPKMAHLIMDFAWGEVSGIAVDTHVHRITHRLGWMTREFQNPEEARKTLEKWFPKSEWSDLNLLFVGFGQQICSPVGPKCSECLNKDLCPSSSCLVSTGLPLGQAIEVSSKSKRKKEKTNPKSTKVKPKKIKLEPRQ